MTLLKPAVPTPGKRIAIRVTPAAERKMRDGHPWLFNDSIVKQSHDGKEGALAVIFDRKGRFLAIGLFDPFSRIRVRILQHNHPATINQHWFDSQLAKAVRLRASLEQSQTNGYRLVHGENDGLPGLVIDRYAGTIVIKLYTLAWLPYLSMVAEALFHQSEWERIVLRFGRLIQQRAKETYDLADGSIIAGPPITGEIVFQENGLFFEADVINGQKTGFFLDQRENRGRVEEFSAGRKVLNVFAYTGGFSLYAARGGAQEVTSLDLSNPVLLTAIRNFQRNEDIEAVHACNHIIMRGDAFLLLNELAESKRLYDMVILDPPSFARRKSQVPRALDAYYRLARLGMGVLRPNGILVSASCSSRVPAEDFFDAVHRAADFHDRQLNEIERTFHPVDHPIRFKEGAYLKCLFAHVG